MDKDRETFYEACEKLDEEMKKISEAVIEAFAEPLEKLKATMDKVYEVTKESTKEDVSRRRFEAVACKGRNRKERW